MSQENAQQEQKNAAVETQTAEGNAFTPITSQEQLDKVIGGRINGIKSKYADYEDLKAKAQKFDELEEANKSELERAQSQVENLESELKSLKQAQERSAWKKEIATECDLPLATVEILQGDTKEEILANAQKIASDMQSKNAPIGIPDTAKSHNAKTTPEENFGAWMVENFE